MQYSILLPIIQKIHWFNTLIHAILPFLNAYIYLLLLPLFFTIYSHFRGIGVAEGYDSDLIWGLFWFGFDIVLVFSQSIFFSDLVKGLLWFCVHIVFVFSKSIVFIATSLRVYYVCGPILFPHSLNISPFILCSMNYLVFKFFGRLQVSRHWRDKCCRRKRNGP